MVIYKAEFPNGKVYIGKSKDYESRKKGHQYSVNHKGSTKMKRAISKYGFESIKWEVIFETDDKFLLSDMQIFYIKEYDSVKNGYNISTGGDGGDTISNNENRLEIIKNSYHQKVQIQIVMLLLMKNYQIILKMII